MLPLKECEPVTRRYCACGCHTYDPPDNPKTHMPACIFRVIGILLIALCIAGCTSNPKYLYPIVDPSTQPHIDRGIVRAVMPNSPASRAGLLPGDEIILSDGEPLDAAIKSPYSARTKKSTEITVLRDGKEIVLKLQRRRSTDLWGDVTALVDQNGHALPVYWTSKLPDQGAGAAFNHDGTVIVVMMVRGYQNALMLRVGVINPTLRTQPFSIQSIRVKNGERGMMWPVPAAEIVATAYAPLLVQQPQAYLPGSAQPPSYTASIYAQTTVYSGYMQTYGTAYITPQQNPYNSFVDMYNMATAIRNSQAANAAAKAERDLSTLNGMALKTVTVPSLSTVDGAVYYQEVAEKPPYFVEVTFNGKTASFEFDEYQFAFK